MESLIQGKDAAEQQVSRCRFERPYFIPVTSLQYSVALFLLLCLVHAQCCPVQKE